MADRIKTWLELLHLIRRNMRARSFRTLAAFVSTVILIGVIFGSTIFYNGVDYSINEGAARIGADLLVTPVGDNPVYRILRLSIPAQQVILTGPLEPSYMDKNVERQTAGVLGVTNVASQLYVGELKSFSETSVNAPVTAIDPGNDFSVGPWLKTSLNEALEGQSLVVGASTPFNPGDTLAPLDMVFTVTGKLEPTGTGLDTMVFMSMESAYKLSDHSPSQGVPTAFKRGQISAVLAKTQPITPVKDVIGRVGTAIPDVQVAGRSEVASSVRTAISGLSTYTTIMGGAMWAMTAVLISAIFAMTVNERRKELGVLRALGATRRYIFSLIVVEVATLTIVGGIVGVLGGGFLLYSFSSNLAEFLGIPYLWPTPATIFLVAGSSMGVAIATALIASVYPSFLSVRIDAYDAIRSGE